MTLEMLFCAIVLFLLFYIIAILIVCTIRNSKIVLKKYQSFASSLAEEMNPRYTPIICEDAQTMIDMCRFDEFDTVMKIKIDKETDAILRIILYTYHDNRRDDICYIIPESIIQLWKWNWWCTKYNQEVTEEKKIKQGIEKKLEQCRFDRDGYEP